MEVRLTVLCENSVLFPRGVIGEHGFACYVETPRGNYLWDTGQGFGIVQNAITLRKDLTAITALILSHGHYDHTGGLDKVLMLRDKTRALAHPDIFVNRYWKLSNKNLGIGMPFSRGFLEGLGAEFELSTDFREVADSVYLTGEVTRLNDFEKGDLGMAGIYAGVEVSPDPIRDDNSLILDTSKGLVILLGCAHAGMINIIDYARQKTGKNKVYAVVGGTHMGFASPAQFEKTLTVIGDYGIERVGVAHCTGLLQGARLCNLLGDKFFFGAVGAVLEV
ncbi:MAG: MBL fold metallo-hydrolase [Deltaproteobacteria bacterium]|nr:MBL fold metallo-hydrolase [Deltaproteobacteria bacterium]